MTFATLWTCIRKGLTKKKKKIAYLLPPRQRTVARFLNLSSWVEWSDKMLNSRHKLNTEEKDVFTFIPAKATLIEELSEIMECIKSIEYTLETAGECRKKVEKTLLSGNTQMIKPGCDIIEFIRKEAALFDLQTIAHHNSSDIFESMFGIFKSRKSPNKLYGITPFILFFPL
jgi:hypothetical protein